MMMVVSIFLASFMLVELSTGRNLFSVFGGVPPVTAVRAGHLRCQGAFSHPLLAGAFGATLLPIFMGIGRAQLHSRTLKILAMLSTIVIALASASSGPAMAVIAGIFGICMWVAREQMRIIRWLSLVGLVLLQIMMKAPVWALLARVGLVGGSTGYHRYILFDNAIRRFGEWWLLGTKTTSHWGYYLWDVTNTYIHVGVDGGFVSLVLFMAILWKCFRRIGIMVNNLKNEYSREFRFFLWSLGASLFAHSVAFMGMSYFGGQIMTSLYLLICMISTATDLQPRDSFFSPWIGWSSPSWRLAQHA
jgi:hypothetical protein